MPPFAALYACQVALAGWAIVVVGRRARVLLAEAPLDMRPFMSALRSLTQQGRYDRALALADRLMPASCAVLTRMALMARHDARALQVVVSEGVEELRVEAARSIDVLQTIGRIAPPLAFAIALVQLGAGLSEDTGLAGLQRGLPQSIALGHAMLSVVTGMTTSLVCRASTATLSRRIRVLQADLDLVAGAFTVRAEPQ